MSWAWWTAFAWVYLCGGVLVMDVVLVEKPKCVEDWMTDVVFFALWPLIVSAILARLVVRGGFGRKDGAA